MNNLSRLNNSLAHRFQTVGFEKDKLDASYAAQIESQVLFERTHVLIVDDDRCTLDQLEESLKNWGIENIRSCFDSQEASHLIGYMTPDIILVDVANGFEILQSIRRLASLQSTDVIVTGHEIDSEQKLTALQLGASAFLTKPVNPLELVLSIRNIIASKAYHDHLSYESDRLASEVHQRIVELEAARSDADVARQEAMHCLARAAEFRDNDTGNHVLRVGGYAAVIARRFGFDRIQLEMFEQAAQLHDVGKIGISDTILLKPDKLTEQEFDKMRQHCEYGSNIILPMSECEWKELIGQPERVFEIVNKSNAPVMKLAALIARTHHEKWDGSGYPLGMNRKEIPLVGRITAIADVFDALASDRPYKPAYSVDKCFHIIRDGRGCHFDPEVVDAFFDAQHEIIATMNELAD